MASTRAWRCWHCYLGECKRMIVKNIDCPVHIAPFGENRLKRGVLELEDGTTFEGTSVGYPEALTDASFTGQILAMTYPLIGNYGVPDQSLWEDSKIHVAGLIVSSYINQPSHVQSTMNLGTWLQREKVPALEIKDTRLLTQYIRTHGTMLGKVVFDTGIPFYDPYAHNLVSQVSTRQPRQEI